MPRDGTASRGERTWLEGKRVHQADKNAQAYAQAVDSAYAQQSPPPQQEPYALPAYPEQDVIAQLERLGALKAQGLLTDEEFAAAKQKLLAG